MSYKQETEEYKAQVAKLYNYLKENHLGAENGIKKPELAEKLEISERELRGLTRLINASPEFEKLVSTSYSCFMCNTEEECKKAIKNTFRTAVSHIKKGNVMAKKVGLNGQIKMALGEDFYDVITTFEK